MTYNFKSTMEAGAYGRSITNPTEIKMLKQIYKAINNALDEMSLGSPADRQLCANLAVQAQFVRECYEEAEKTKGVK